MNSIVTKKQKLLITIGLFVISYLSFIFIGKPIYKNHSSMDQKIQNKILFIQKYKKIAKQKPFYEAKVVNNKSINTKLNQKFHNETKPTLAAASQQGLMEELARQTGVNIVRVRIEKPKYVEELLSISTKITTRSTLKNLTRFIHSIENNDKFMIIEEVSTQRINSKELEELQSQLTIRGFIKILEKTNVI